jgi:LCP family protein required for cell wall assembly
MLRTARVLFLLLILVFGLVGCNLPAWSGEPLNITLALDTPRPTYILMMPGATITPTPFQPAPQLALNEPPGEQPGTSATPSATQTVVAPVATSQEQSELDQLPNQFNILLLGSDQRPWDVGFRTDTIILLTINKDLTSANLTSFPRDLYVTIPGYGLGRINTAWGMGGAALLKKTLNYNFGVRPDYYVLVNFSSFKRIVDSLGGLDVQVAQPLSDYRSGYWVTVHAGKVHMDADMVLWYARSRITTSDFERNQRQQEVLTALYEKLLSVDALKRAPEFYQIYKDNVTTDIGLVNILSWLPLAARIADAHNIHQYFISHNQVSDWITPEGGMVLLPDMDAVMRVIRKSQNLK